MLKTLTEERVELIYILTVNCKNNGLWFFFFFTVTQVLFSHVKHMGLKDTQVEELEKKYGIFS